MKAKKYRLETVLDIRTRAKDEAARIVGLRIQQLEQAEIELNRRRMNLQACYERQNQTQLKMNSELNKGIQTRNILNYQNYLNDLRNQEVELQTAVDKQIKVVVSAEEELEKARKCLIETAKELKSIVNHKANWKTAEQTLQNRREQKISDEIGAILHSRKREN